MNKKLIYGLILPTIAFVSTNAFAYTMRSLSNSGMSMDELKDYKVIDMDFNSNEIKNNVNNKKYNTVFNKSQLVNSIKGKGFKPNDDYLVIKNSDLNISDTDEYMTVSFQYKYGGTDDIQMLCAFGLYDLYFYQGLLGFNTGIGDIYGIKYTPPTTEYINITATFHKTDVTKNKIYINGERKELSNQTNRVANIPTNPFRENFYLAYWQYSEDIYTISDSSIIDEFKLYKTDITDAQAKKLAMAHNVPELSLRKEGSYVRPYWATEILESDTIYKFDFEEGQSIPSLDWAPNITGDKTGGQKVTSNEAFSGTRSVFTPKSDNWMGNWYNFPQTKSNENIMGYGRLYIPSGTKLSISFRTKNIDTKNNKLMSFGDGGWGATVENLSSKAVEYTPIGSRTLKVDSLSGLYVGRAVTTEKTNAIKSPMLQITAINDNYDGTYTLTFNIGTTDVMSVGENLKTRPWRGAWSFPETIHNNTDWKLYNVNTTVTSYSDYDVSVRGGTFYIGTENLSDGYLDDIRFGYATKVKLYRDGTKIYEGYDSQYNDTSAVDKVAPTMDNNFKINSIYENDNKKITIDFKKATDTGSDYTYSIQGIGNSGTETFLSESQNINITSELKGYSYVIDKSPSTIPSNTVNLSKDLTSIIHTLSKTDTGKSYLHIKPIDNQGNVGAVQHILIDNPTLTAVAKPSEDLIRLDWTMDDVKNKTFKVYQKKPGSNDFNTISMTDIDKTKTVKVLNIYPTYNVPDKLTSEVDIAGKQQKQSAMLNEWIRDYGMGIIEVDSLNKEDFEANPDKWIKNSDGTYKYDVITVGFWNISQRPQHMNNVGTGAIGEFIDSGRGVLIGHHHMGYREFDYGMNRLKEKFGVKLLKEEGAYQTDLGNIDYVLPEKSPGMDESYYWTYGSKVKAVRKGNLLNFPHNIGEEGKIFTVPVGHDTWEFATGDIWMQYVNPKSYVNPVGTLDAKDINVLPDGTVGTSNVYLTTFNNTAIIQTGHSNNFATEDEKKIMANAIFYLNQLSGDNFLNDNSGQDVTAPNKPSVKNHSFSGGSLKFDLNSTVDNGSTYEYYVQAGSKDGLSQTTSNIAKETITSGFKGYSYVVDSKADTIPDNTVDTISGEISTPINNNSLYLHVKSIDNVGNVSETLHYSVSDTTKPTLSITGNPTSWTNQNVNLTITANDLGSGIREIVLPNGNKVTGVSTTYTIYENGSYQFKVIDNMGNETLHTVVVDKIDKTIKNIVNNKVNMEFLNTNSSTRRINFNFDAVADSESGLKGYSYVIDKNPSTIPSNTVNLNTTTITKDITDNGVYYIHIKAIDNAGNVSLVIHQKIDIPTLTSKENPKEDIIRLDWTMDDISNKTFKTYQKKPGSNEFQSISATNFDSDKQVRVLNVHPNIGSNISFTTWDGEILTLPKSAQLKKWMEEPNYENAKGYGKGLIEVTAISINDFNSNPSEYLNKSNNEWNYDVIMFGSWDSNGSKDISTDALSLTKLFVEDGKGILLGHDILRLIYAPTFNNLREYINIELAGDENISSEYDNMKYNIVSNSVKKNKEGLLTNYPWLIDKDNLNVPLTHSRRQWANGDVWFEFQDFNDTALAGSGNVVYKGLNNSSTNNFYLTTYNNGAMIQTGHSTGQATSDEQKILANTLFYLNQLSSDNFLDDNSGQDVGKPDKVTINNYKYTEDGFIEFNFNGVKDNGSTYEYYVSSEDNKANSQTLSNVTKTTITSGLKGYSYIVDSKPDTIPDNEIELVVPETIKIKTNSKNELYVHIKAVDNVGNASETLHYKLSDTEAPKLSFTLNPASWTSGDVKITVKATDNISGVKNITLPNGMTVSGDVATFTVSQNGAYTFQSLDYMGNISLATLSITNIDKNKPILSIINNQNWINTDVNVTITSTDK